MDVGTLRRALENLTHFGVTTAAVWIRGSMHVYGYTDCTAVYLTLPASTTEYQGNLPVSHLVKLLRSCTGQSVVRLKFYSDYLRVENEVVYKVKCVDVPFKSMVWPTVQPCARFMLSLPTLFRFLRLAGDTVQVERSHGVSFTTSYQGMMDSTVDFPTFDDPMLTVFGVPLLCREVWPDDLSFSTPLLKQLCRSQSFSSHGKLIVCRGHLVYEAWRDDVQLLVCFSAAE